MVDYLLDTNHASVFLGRGEPLASHIHEARQEGHNFGISVTVLGELYYAAYASRDKDKNLKALTDFLQDALLWPFDTEAAEEYGRIQAEQRAKGRPIPPLDAQIAAVARRYGLVVLTADQHFSWVDGLTAENWMAGS